MSSSKDTVADPEKKSKFSFASCFSAIWNKLFDNETDKLIECIKRNDIEKFIFFHKVKNFNFNKVLKNGDTIFLIAARYNKLDIMKYMLMHVTDLIKEEKSVHGDTALMIATFNNDLYTIRFLIDLGGLSVNCRDNQGFTPLIAACANGFLDIAIFLLCLRKADPNITGYNKQSALHRAAYYGQIKILRLLKKYTKLKFSHADKNGNTPMHLAAMKCHVEAIRVMLEYVSEFVHSY